MVNINNNKYMQYTTTNRADRLVPSCRRASTAGSAGAQQIRTRYAQAVKHCTAGAQGSEGPCKNSRERDVYFGASPPAVLRPRPAVAVAQLVARAVANPRPCGSSHTGGAAGAASHGIEVAGGGSHPAGGGLPGAGAGGSAGTGGGGRGSRRPGGGTGCGGCFGRVGSLGGASLVATSAVAFRTSRALFMPTFFSSGPLHAPASEEGIMLSLAVVLFSQERVIGPTTWTKT